jgi:hypothetical protein
VSRRSYGFNMLNVEIEDALNQNMATTYSAGGKR